MISKEEESRMVEQKSVYTKYINFHLSLLHPSLSPPTVDDLYTDLRDGRVLNYFLHALTKRPLEQLDSKQTRLHHFINVQKMLKVVEELTHITISKMNIGAEDIVDGNPRITLGLVWVIILRVGVVSQLSHLHHHTNSSQSEKSQSEKSQSDVVKDLLKWINEKLSSLNMHVSSFKPSEWRDGKVFAGLVHAWNPSTISMTDLDHVLKSTREDEYKDILHSIFEIVTCELNVPVMIDANIFEKVDEKVLVTYVSAISTAMQTIQPLSPIMEVNQIVSSAQSYQEETAMMKVNGEKLFENVERTVQEPSPIAWMETSTSQVQHVISEDAEMISRPSSSLSKRRRSSTSISPSETDIEQNENLETISNTRPKKIQTYHEPVVPKKKIRTYECDRTKLDFEVGRIVLACPYTIPVRRDRFDGKFQREGRYFFGKGEKQRLVTCRLTGPHVVVVRVGGGWAQLEEFLLEHSHLKIEDD